MLPKLDSSRAPSRYRRPLYAIGAATLAVPLMLSSTAAHAVSAVPADAVQAITSGSLLADFQQEYLAAVNSENIWANDVKLSHEIGPRVAGSAAEDEAIDWVVERFASYGLTTKTEEFAARAQRFADVTPSRYTEEYASWQFRPSGNGPLTGEGAPTSGQIVDIGATLTDLATRTDLAGKVVLADWNASSGVRTTLLTDLKAAGVAAVIFGSTSSEGLPNVGNLATAVSDMVVVGSSRNQTNRMRTLLADGALSVSIDTQVTDGTSQNAIGVLPAANGDADAPIIYLGAHIDSVVGSPGASDNGSGVSILLEIARIMSQQNYDKEIRFGVWGAEEIGIVGSNYHVKTVMTQEERDRTLGAWNMDMAGTSFPGNDGEPPFVFWALTADNPNLPPLTPDQSPVLNYSNNISLQAGEGPLPIGTVGRSDHQPFYDMGIPAAVFSWMHWAGGSNIKLEPAYHQTSDTLEFVSEARMGHAARILGGGAFTAAMNVADFVVTDENGDPAADSQVAMTCEGDEGWRDAGTTDAGGLLSTFIPTTTCDFVVLADNGARGMAAGVGIGSDTEEIAIALEVSETAITLSTTPAPSDSGWFTASPVVATLSATNDFGDAMTLEYSLDGGNWVEYVDGVTVPTQGLTSVSARATDGFGNTSEEVTWPLSIDSVAPALAVTADAKKRGSISGTASDDTSGLASIQYRIGTGEWVTVESDSDVAARAAAVAPTSFAVDLKLGAGATTVHVRAFDVAGNVTNAGTLNFAPVPGGLTNTGAETGMFAGIAAAALLMVGGGAILVTRRIRSQRVSEEA